MSRVIGCGLAAVLLVGCTLFADRGSELRESLGPLGAEASTVGLIAEGDRWRLVGFRDPDGMVCTSVVRELDGAWEPDGAGCDPPGPLEHPTLSSFETTDRGGNELQVWLWQVSVDTAAIEATLDRGQPREEQRTVTVPVGTAADLGVFYAVLPYDARFRVSDSVALDRDGEQLWSRSGSRW